MREYKKFIQKLTSAGWNIESTIIPIVRKVGVNEDGTPKMMCQDRILYKGTMGVLKVNFYNDDSKAVFSAPRFHMDVDFPFIKKIIRKEDSHEIVLKMSVGKVGLYYEE